MTDTTTVVAPFEPEDDLDLIIAFVQERLDPARVARVRQRLEDDPDFLHMATPFVMAATIPKRHEVEPAPRGEMERHWDEFTRRAGFIHQKRRARQRLVRGVAIAAALAGAGWLARGPVLAWHHERFDFVDVGRAGEWVAVTEHAEVRVAPGARFRMERGNAGERYDFGKLAGAAEFRVAQPFFNRPVDSLRLFMVSTPAGTVSTLRGSFAARSVADTTWVEARPLANPERIGSVVLPTQVFMRAVGAEAPSLQLDAGMRGRVVKGGLPEIVP